MLGTRNFFNYSIIIGGQILSANLESKKQLVEEIKEKLSKAKSIVFVSFLGTNVASDTKLRADIRAGKNDYKVYKNTLLLKALKEMGIEGTDEYLHGSTSVAIDYNDEVTVAKVISNAQKDNEKLQIKFGIVNGQVVDDKYVKQLASIPSREELYAKLAFLLKSPMQKLAIGLKAVADKK